jgi:hypothetical protein
VPPATPARRRSAAALWRPPAAFALRRPLGSIMVGLRSWNLEPDLPLHNSIPEAPLLRNISVNVARFSMVIGLAACASSGAAGGTARTSPDRITRSEIYSSNATNAYELINRLRPNWLRPGSTGSIGGGVVQSQAILVYLNSQQLEDLNALKTISADGLESAQWIDASRVQTVLNYVPTGPIAGAIVLKTR